MFRWYSILVVAFTCSACKGNTAQADPDNRPPLPSALGKASLAPSVRWIKGDELGRLARAYGNRGTLFNVWATWCGSCKGEFPIMRQIAEQYASRGLQVVPVSVDEPEQLNQLVEWLQTRGFQPPAWVAARPLDVFKSSVASNWLGNIPITLFYDAQGKRRFFWNGPVAAAELTPILDGFLEGKTIDGEKHYALSAGITDPRPGVSAD